MPKSRLHSSSLRSAAVIPIEKTGLPEQPRLDDVGLRETEVLVERLESGIVQERDFDRALDRRAGRESRIWIAARARAGRPARPGPIAETMAGSFVDKFVPATPRKPGSAEVDAAGEKRRAERNAGEGSKRTQGMGARYYVTA